LRLGVYLDKDATMLAGFRAYGLPTSILIDEKHPAPDGGPKAGPSRRRPGAR